MENQIKVSLWIDELLKEVNETSLTDFNPANQTILRITNHQYDEIFSHLVKGRTIKVGNEYFKKDLDELKKAKLNARQVHMKKPSEELKEYVKDEGTK